MSQMRAVENPSLPKESKAGAGNGANYLPGVA